MSVELPATAGNEYQDLHTEIAFIVEAVQGNADVENDEVIVTSGGTPAANGEALVAAIDAVSEGGTVYVAAGEFNLPKTTYTSSINGNLEYGILVNKSFSLKGAMAGIPAGDAARGTGETVIDSTIGGYNSGAILFAAYDVDVVIDGFTFESGAWDIIGNDDPGVRKVTITNNIFKVAENSNASTPIKLKLVSGEISDNKFIGTNCGYGVRVNEMSESVAAWGGTVPTDLKIDVTIANNDFTGFTLNNTSRGVVSVNPNENFPGTVVVEGNNFTDTNGLAINKEKDIATLSVIARDNIGVTANNVSEGVTLENEYIADGFFYSSAEATYSVSNANGLRYFAQSVNDGTTYAGKTIVLTDDIDLAGVEWTPIGNVKDYPTITFKGTFDGNNKTIYNMTVKDDTTPSDATAGFFGSLCGTVQNVNFVNAGVESVHYAGVVAGYSSTNGAKIINCHVSASVVVSTYADADNSGDKAGGIIGYLVSGDTVKDCSVKNVTVTAARDVGGIAGCAENPAGLTNNTVTDVTINLTDASRSTWGFILGRKSDNSSVSGDTFLTEGSNTINGTNMAIVPIADGFVKNLVTSNYEVSNANGLRYFAQSVNSGTSYAGKTIVLTDDIDLAGVEWTPIGNASAKFSGTFDGNGKTISNLKITRGLENIGANSYIGLFGVTTSSAVLKNFTVNNADVSGSLNVAVVLGGGGGAEAKISNVHVSGKIEVYGYWYVGAILGKGYSTIENCSVIGDSAETSYVRITGGYAGGVVGYMGEGNNQINGCTVKNITVKGASNGVGGVSGILHYGNMISGCTLENVVVWQTDSPKDDRIYCGAFAGTRLDNNGASIPTVKDCVFSGKLYSGAEKTDVTAADRYVGDVWYGTTTSQVTITGCVVSGSEPIRVTPETAENLQSIIDEAPAGAIIYLAEGEYDLNGLDADKTIYLIGAGQDKTIFKVTGSLNLSGENIIMSGIGITFGS